MIGGMNYASDVKPNNYEGPALYGSGHLKIYLAKPLRLFAQCPQPKYVSDPIQKAARYGRPHSKWCQTRRLELLTYRV